MPNLVNNSISFYSVSSIKNLKLYQEDDLEHIIYGDRSLLKFHHQTKLSLNEYNYMNEPEIEERWQDFVVPPNHNKTNILILSSIKKKIETRIKTCKCWYGFFDKRITIIQNGEPNLLIHCHCFSVYPRYSWPPNFSYLHTWHSQNSPNFHFFLNGLIHFPKTRLEITVYCSDQPGFVWTSLVLRFWNVFEMTEPNSQLHASYL